MAAVFVSLGPRGRGGFGAPVPASPPPCPLRERMSYPANDVENVEVFARLSRPCRAGLWRLARPAGEGAETETMGEDRFGKCVPYRGTCFLFCRVARLSAGWLVKGRSLVALARLASLFSSLRRGLFLGGYARAQGGRGHLCIAHLAFLTKCDGLSTCGEIVSCR